MSADNDIVERLEAMARFYDNQAAHSLNHGPNCYAIRAELARDTAAEIVRLRGEVPSWIATWMADRSILPDDDGDGISEGALVEALNNHERELLAATAKATIAPAETKGDGGDSRGGEG